MFKYSDFFLYFLIMYIEIWFSLHHLTSINNSKISFTSYKECIQSSFISLYLNTLIKSSHSLCILHVNISKLYIHLFSISPYRLDNPHSSTAPLIPNLYLLPFHNLSHPYHLFFFHPSSSIFLILSLISIILTFIFFIS